MIHVSKLDFGYTENPVLQDISFRVAAGNLCGILGANGSGKTTLLKCMHGILPVISGNVQICGKTMHKMGARKRAAIAAYVPQDTKQFGTGTVFETVLLGRKPHFGSNPSCKDIDIVSQVLAELELEDMAMRPVQTLSGGQRQRVCIAKALSQQTPVIIMDEPTANLDLKYKIEVMNILSRLAEKGKTIVISVHDISIAYAYCTELVLLKSGKMIDKGGKEVLSISNIEKLYDVDYNDVLPLVETMPGVANFSEIVCN